jgi:hypothetical protein
MLTDFDGVNGEVDRPPERLWQPKSQPAGFLVKADLKAKYEIKCE